MNTLLVFMYVFAFRIYSFFDSSVLVGVILTVKAIFNKKYHNIMLSNLRQKNNFITFIIILFLVFLMFLTIILNNVSDYSYIKTFFHLLITLFVGYELYSYLEYKNCSNKVANYLIYAFIIQTMIQWIFFVFPSISVLFNPFRSQTMIDRMSSYAGYRGIALTTSGFFSLASAYSIIYFLYFSKTYIVKHNLIYYLIFAFLITGTFFAGRTGFVGLLFLVIYLLFNRFNINTKISKDSIKKMFLVIFCVGISILMLIKASKNDKFTNLFSFAFELINNFHEKNQLSSSSTDKLIKMYDVEIPFRTYIIGDGMYNVNNGKIIRYYKNVDVGYLRKIFFFGFPGLLLSILFQISLFGKSIKKKECLYLLLLLLILELKGEIVGISIICNSIIILYSLQLSKQKSYT